MNPRMLLSLFLVSLVVFCVRTEEVTEVIDGDTFRTATGSSVRLLGINAPEINDPGGDIAKHALAWMIMNKEVRMVTDVTDKDDYGRLLRYVFVGDVNVNAEMVRLGYAERRFFPPDTLYLEEMRELEKIAIRNRSGLWALPVFQFSDTTSGAAPKTMVRSGELDVIQWQEADQYYNQNKIVEGKIVASNNTGKVCFLNFHKDWRRYFTAVIFASDFDKFPEHPEDYYLNRVVRVRGLVKEYRGKPEIILKSPNQIEIVE
ncbi:MAG: thermonuclease family protein [candidate division WOR-3 bacterium]|nr:MAG: thermonuclease family protein [candidate division WOR-3 bacterium]